MCGLSATFPKIDSEDGKLLFSIFGTPIQLSSKAIVSRNVFLYDFREKCQRRGHLDQFWNGMSVRQVIRKVCDGIEGIPKLETFDGNHKFLVTTDEVKESIVAARLVLEYFNSLKIDRKVIVIRESIKGAFIVSLSDFQKFDSRKNQEQETLQKTRKDSPKDEIERFITDNCEKIPISEIDGSEAVGVFGCSVRLKEGINIKSLVFGICTSFNYSIPFRIQILGRIRRTDEDIKRFFVVCSGKAPNDAKYWNHHLVKHPTKITYPFEYESEQFAKNGIIRI